MQGSNVMAVTPEGVGSAIETIDDAIAEDARLKAVSEIADERRKALKAWVGSTLSRAGDRVDAEGIGTALLTDPSTVPTIVDDAAFRAWAITSHPDRTDTVARVDPVKIEQALAGGDDLADRLAEILDEISGAVTTEVLVDGKLTKDLAKPANSRELDDGRLVDKRTGEIIPGLELRQASQPAPQIKPDRDLVAKIADEIRGRLTPVPSLGEGDR